MVIHNDRLPATQRKPVYDIVFACPGETFTAEFLKSFAKTVKVLDEQHISWTLVNFGSTYVRLARERIMSLGDWANIDNSIAFQDEFDYKSIMWIDSDIMWEPEDVLALWRSRHKITSGWYQMTDGNASVSFDGLNAAPAMEFPNEQKYYQAVTVGFGFLMVDKGIFESMTKPWFDNYILEHEGRLVTAIGEDSSWCIQAHNAGHDIWVDSTVRVGHIKKVRL